MLSNTDTTRTEEESKSSFPTTHLTTYDTKRFYQDNFDRAYRKFVLQSASDADCRDAEENYSLFTPMEHLSWYNGYIPLSAVKDEDRDMFV